ncbi:HPr family phosphocarrier protein [Priestia filamentosa]|uniref:PTS sugar transporter n=1 Tax=Priestia filamentosa TaxID=1402861 RepID=A0A1X7DDS1_9BACI|nr:HPr family phosphocarrier protein [Priestia filamentosa]AKO93565.1 PTS sugar transporter [Priestia filamentosa]MDT3763774.1 HPr family phosphocarrier protein [Priestia filamentosa]OXS71736.1 PTS sugar transporter [Priestia filamentosa]RJS67381.1 HPr family phosphocarrier protein [Priestia filamentosa]WRU94196.1 HPr family phosphocarrier protein [Priestia filamentosa]
MVLNKSLAKVVVEINETANKFQSSIVIKTDDKTIDAKSILGLTYTVLNSQSFQVEIHGEDEEGAKRAMSHVFWKNNLPIELV